MDSTSISEASWQMPKQHRRVVVMQSEYGASSRPYLWRILERVGCMKSASRTSDGVSASVEQTLPTCCHAVMLATARHAGDQHACCSVGCKARARLCQIVARTLLLLARNCNPCNAD